MASRASAPSGSRTFILLVRGQQSVDMELRRMAGTRVDMSCQNLEKLSERAEALRKKTPEEFLKAMKNEFQASRDSINEDLNTFEAECERTKPDPNNYDLETPQGREKLRQAEELWMKATVVVVKATRTWTQYFKGLVEKGVQMLKEISTVIVNGVRSARKAVKEFLVWFADEVVKNAKIVAQNFM